MTTCSRKVVAPVAGVSGLKLRVEVELPADQDEQQASIQGEKIRGALRDLGIEDDVETK